MSHVTYISYKHKRKIAEDKGFELLEVWETNYRSNKDQTIKNLIRHITNKYEFLNLENKEAI